MVAGLLCSTLGISLEMASGLFKTSALGISLGMGFPVITVSWAIFSLGSNCFSGSLVAGEMASWGLAICSGMVWEVFLSGAFGISLGTDFETLVGLFSP